MYDEIRKEIFISYRRVDNANDEVTEFKEKLQEKSKLEVYFDENHMENGDFTDRLRNAVSSCNCFVPIVSENYINFRKSSDWCKEELKLAIKNKKLIVPIFICDTDKINEKYQIDTTTEKRKDTNIIDEWNDADLIKYLTVSNGVTAISKDNIYSLKDGIELIDTCVKNIFNSFCESSKLSFFHNLLEKQKQALKQVSIQNTSYSFDMDDYIDLGITGKPTKAEKEEAERKQEQEQGKQRPLIEFLPNLNHFSVKNFIDKFEKEKFAVVTGDAGQGKSIFLKKVCMTLCDNAKKNGLSKDKLFPIYAEIKKIPLPKDFDDNYSFFEALAKASVNGITKEQIESVFDNGKPCLILDAMDEVSPETFDKLHDEILKANIVDKCYILLSSRPGQKKIKLSNSSGISVELFGKTFRLWTVDNISDENFDIFVKKETLKNRYDENDECFINNFSHELKEKEETDNKYKYMSRNPFMLKSIVLTYYGKGVLPKNKVEAFDQAVNNLITREQKGEEAPIELIKEVLGYIAYNSYSELDRNAKNEYSTNKNNGVYISDYDKSHAINEFVSSDNGNKTKVSSFVNNLVNENGFSHELFACYYCAFYLYRNIIEDKSFIEFFLKDINPNTDYWRGVIEMLICLFEFNATLTKVPKKLFTLRKLLETMLESMQKVVDMPDYDILYGAVSQFIDHEYNKPMGESVLIKGMLERGERGIKSFDKETFECSDGANPYEELFYYVVVYNFALGFNKIHNDNKGNNNLSAIQTHLYNELCKLLDKDNRCLQEKPVDDFAEQFALASSEKRYAKKNLKGHVNIDNNVENIGFRAFEGCSALTSITIPDSVRSIGKSAFSLCSGLTIIDVSKNNKFYHVEGNCLIETKTNTIIRVCDNYCIIPNYVMKISDGAFNGCSKFINIYIPDSVVEIGNWAFESCSSLTNIFIPNSVVKIGDYAFAGCSALTNITIPDGVTNIGYHTFDGCSKLTTLSLGKNVEFIGNYAFCDCSALQALTIPNNVKMIAGYAFDGCSALTTLLLGKSVQIIGNDAFGRCIALTSVVIPDSVTLIGERAFKDSSALTTLSLGKSVQIIDNLAFSDCSALQNFTIPNSVEIIGACAFFGCSRINNIKIPDKVQSIGISAFDNCSALTNITIPNSVKIIGDWAFDRCISLTDIFYKGKKEQWQLIEGIEDCRIDYKKCTVHCINGDICGDKI